jgi:hypothetical protein
VQASSTIQIFNAADFQDSRSRDRLAPESSHCRAGDEPFVRLSDFQRAAFANCVRITTSGVPLNTVRDLLGHGSVGMSLRYAHLAPDQRREAVSKLNERPLLTLTMRLQWGGLPAATAYRMDSIVVREEQELAGQIPLFGNPSVLELRL